MNAEALAALERLGGATEETSATDQRGDPASEIPLARPAPRNVRRAMAPHAIRIPKWYRVAVPVMFVVGAALTIIGLWAAGAMIYMRTTTPSAPDFVADYPLIRWDENLGESGEYTDESRTMAAAMLACIPVAGIMGGMVVVMRRQMRSASGKR
jgi:hypothetical protein